jgi:type IV secretory pathway VirJ component
MRNVILVLILATQAFSAFAFKEQESYSNPQFGKLNIYEPTSIPSSFVLFISGDGGWNTGVDNMAKSIVKLGAFVVGVDITQYFQKLSLTKSKCYYPSGDFEELSMLLQKKYHFKEYLKPVLIGYSAGATLVYGMLVQAPANTFKGAIVFGFSPDLDIDRPLCAGWGLKQHVIKDNNQYFLEATDKLSAPFVVIHGNKDKVCPFEITNTYMKQMPEVEFIELANVGHGFSATEKWMPFFTPVYSKVLKTPSFAEQKNASNTVLQKQNLDPLHIEMPLTLIPTAKPDTLPMVFFISGDGGWASFDHTIGETFAKKGMPVVGLDAQKYFWNFKSPEQTAQDISNTVAHYLQQWKLKSFIIVGYSFGGCIVPFVINKLPDGLNKSVKGAYCLSPATLADFEIHLIDMMNFNGPSDKYDVVKEIKNLKYCNSLCIFGEDEDQVVINSFSKTGTSILILPGKHSFDNDAERVVTEIIKSYEKMNKKY